MGGIYTTRIQQYWKGITKKGRIAEEKFLKYDLVFPLIYGGAVATSLLWARAKVGWPTHLAWIIIPLAIVFIADWTENLIQLEQLKKFRNTGPNNISPSWIRVASFFTVIKLGLVAALLLSLIGNVGAIIVSGFRKSRV